MSIMAENNVYETIADEAMNEQLSLAACETSSAFMFMPKIERNVEEVMNNVEEEEIVDGQTEILHDGIIHDTYSSMERPAVYYEEAFSACEEVEVDYKPSLSSTMIPDVKMQDNWQGSDQFETSSLDTSLNENPENMASYPEESENADDSDEETIATFLTSAGQRLALYAVEDSDEVFAVAVYDESGDPPTNFQFLMKSDVERLIGEGAVRTVKKPTQMKKQLLSADTPVFAQQNVEEPIVKETQLKTEVVQATEYENNEIDTHTPTCSHDENLSSTEILLEPERNSSPLPDANLEQPDISYVLMEEDSAPAVDEIEAKYDVEVASVELNRSDEFIERSTVQYILLEDDSEGELTLADVEETFKKDKSSDKSLLKKPLRTNVKPTEEDNSSNGVPVPDAIPEEEPIVNIPTTPPEDNTATVLNVPSKSYKSPKPMRKTLNSLICRREKFIDERFKVSSGTSLLISNSEAKNTAAPSVPAAAVQICPRVKRSRKQQLTSVNRDDSEIIIQPASFPSEEEEDEPTRKRGRGKRKSSRPTTYKTKALAKKKIAKIGRLRAVEVIEIDVDEGDRLQGKNAIVEITIDESKEKGSSDKENEVIMVGDSEDEEQEAATSKKTSSTILLTCVHCSRTFRQKRALRTHSRICPKAPNNVRRMNEKAARRNAAKTNHSSTAKKEYACKICQEKFDVVVALARHVRAMHSQRKKLNSVPQTPVKAPESTPKIKDTPRKSSLDETTSVSPKEKIRTKIKANNRSWKSKKLHCLDCGKWFSSDALLAAHSLQHATKKSEQQTRRCQTCKKIFKSRLLYIRHMRMHSRAKQLQKKLHHTRQATGKTTALRKRGRPRKL